MQRPASDRESESSPRSSRNLAESLLLRSFLEILPDAVVAMNPEGVIVQVNAQAESMFGYAQGELVGQKIEVLVPERYRARHEHHREDFQGKPKVRRMGAGLDLYGKRRDGSEFPVEIALSPVPTERGTLVMSAIRDITDRKRVEAELRQAHEELNRTRDRQLWEYQSRLASIVASSDDAIIGKDLEGIVTTWNQGAERIYGYRAEEVIGQSIGVIVPGEHSEELAQILAKIRRGESVEHHESVRIAKDGRRLHMSISVSAVRDSEGTIVGASVIARDITDQKRSEEQLRQAQKMEAVGRLAGGLAHDFNNILGAISSCTELLRDRIDAGSAAAGFVDTIREGVQRGASLTRQLMAFSRKQNVRAELLDVDERLRATSKLLRPLMGDDVEVAVGRRSENAIVEIDPGQFDQVVMNLAVNSRDAMPQGGKFIMETATLDFDEGFTRLHQPMKPGKYVMLAVSDTGTGMDAATVSRIFEPFYTTKEIGKGTGLGLATVYGIVQQSGGHIWVYSEPGRGTTFKIYLPCAEEKIRDARKGEAQSAPPRREGTTILLVEDDVMLRRLTRQMLEEHGYTVLEAEEGKAALKIAKEKQGAIGLVLTDVVMRGMSGPELVGRMKELYPAMKAVYMSGYTGELIAERDLAANGVALLEKPFTRTSLLKTVDEELD